MINRFLKISIAFLILIIHLSFSYYYFGSWWNSLLGTLLILLFALILWRKKFIVYTGLKIGVKQGFFSILLMFTLLGVFYFFMKNVAEKNGIELIQTNWKNYFHICFYVINEELVFGSLILLPLVKSRKLNPLVASFGLAFVFALGHYIFYRWIFLDRGLLQFSTIVVLFLVGVLRNNLIVCSGHIGYSWALHYSWMIIMFGFHHINVQNKTGLTELTRFNMYLGTTTVLVVSFLLVLVSVVYMHKRILK